MSASRTRRRTLWLASTLGAILSCAQETPEVEVSVALTPVDRGMAAIADEEEPSDAVIRWIRHRWGSDAHEEAEVAAQPETLDTEPPVTRGAFERLVRQLREAPLEELAIPVHNLAHPDPVVWPQVRETLLAERVGSKTQFKRILALIGGDVPNRYGHFERSWKRAHGYRVKLSEDWFADLQAIPAGQISSAMRPVYRDALLTVALAHGAARIGREDPELTGEVVETLLDLAYHTGGTFRDEVGRAITSIGDEAVPHLVRAAVEPRVKREDDPRRRRARYASYNLDRLDRQAPSRAIEAAKATPRRLVALLDAYADAKPGDAASELLALADHPDRRIRRAARSAFRAYVEGPPPRMRVKLVRRIGGVVERRQAALSYRALATLAIREAVEARIPEQLEPECEVRREDGSYDQRCLAQPKRLTDILFSHLDDERARSRREGIEAALARTDHDEKTEATLDALLLDFDLREAYAGPELEQKRQAVVAFYLARSEAFEAPLDESIRLRKAARHALEARAQALRGRALWLESQSEGLTPEGREMLLAKAAEAGFEPDSAAADAPPMLPPEGPSDSAAHRSWLRIGWTSLLALISLLALAWLGARRRVARPADLRSN